MDLEQEAEVCSRRGTVLLVSFPYFALLIRYRTMARLSKYPTKKFYLRAIKQTLPT